jgi:hypothetical protein
MVQEGQRGACSADLDGGLDGGFGLPDRGAQVGEVAVQRLREATLAQVQQLHNSRRLPSRLLQLLHMRKRPLINKSDRPVLKSSIDQAIGDSTTPPHLSAHLNAHSGGAASA